MRHLCDDKDCIYFGQPTVNSCRCHKTAEQMLIAENARLRAPLERIAKNTCCANCQEVALVATASYRSSVENAALGERTKAAQAIVFLYQMFSDHDNMDSWIAELKEDYPELAQAVVAITNEKVS